MKKTKYEVRRAILTAMADYPGPASLGALLGHPRIAMLDESPEALHDEWLQLIEYDFLVHVPGWSDVAELSRKERQHIQSTGNPSFVVFLWGPEYAAGSRAPKPTIRTMVTLEEHVSRLARSVTIALAEALADRDCDGIDVSIRIRGCKTDSVVHHTQNPKNEEIKR